MSRLQELSTDSISACRHASVEDYTRFVYAHTEKRNYRKLLLNRRSRFVQRYPDLRDWFKAPLIERVGRLYGEHAHDASYPESYLARSYLKFLAVHGYAQFDWEWILAIGEAALGNILDYANGAAGVDQLVEDAVQLGYRQKSARDVLQWITDRVFLFTARPHVDLIRESDLDALAEAVLRFGEREDIPLFFGSVERYQRVMKTRLKCIYTMRVVLYHRGQISTEPRISHVKDPRPAVKPRMEAVVARYLPMRRLTGRPSTIRHLDAILRHFIAWLAQTYPHLETFAEVTRDHLLAYAEALNTLQNPRTKQPLAASTKQNILSFLSGFFRDVVNWQWEDVPSHPLLYGGDLPKRPLRIPRYIPEDELERLMPAIRQLSCPYRRAALLIARWSGARRGEIRRLPVDCLDSYPDGTPRLRIPVGKNKAERLIPLHEEAAEAIRTLQRLQRRTRGLRDEQTGVLTHYLFMRRGQMLSVAYLFDDALQEICTAAGLLTPDGKPTVTAHRFRHTVGTQLANRGAKLHTIMKVLGHQSMQMAVVYAQISDQEVLKDYQAVLGPGATIAGPAAEALRSGELSASAIDWLKTNYLKTELELGRCLRLPQEGPCECDLYLTCAKFVTTPEYTPRLRRRRRIERELIEDAIAHGWQREVERHQCTVRRIEQLLTDLGESIEGPEATDS